MAAISSHPVSTIPCSHMMVALGWFLVQSLMWLLAFFSFMFPGAESGTRSKLAPWHVFFGIVIFFIAIVTAETGLVERFIFLGLRQSQEALVVNFTGLLILLFGISVGLAVILPNVLISPNVTHFLVVVILTNFSLKY